jgi:tetratricopeptide (TPR) repeat protein
LGNIDSAIFYYKRALAIDSSFVTASFAIGDLYLSVNKPAEAIPYFEASVRQVPADYAGYERLSRALLVEKQPEKSILVLRKATEKIPTNSQPCVTLARIYHSLNKDDSTRYWLEHAISINPADQDAKGLLQNLGSK